MAATGNALVELEGMKDNTSGFSRVFFQMIVLIKLFWKEKFGSWKVTLLEIVFPAYPVIMAYIIISLDIFPYERFEFEASTYEPIPVAFIPSTESIGLGPSVHPDFEVVKSLLCQRAFLQEPACNAFQVFETEEQLLAQRSELTAGLIFESEVVEGDAVFTGFNLMHLDETTLGFVIENVTAPEDGRPMSIAEGINAFGIAPLQKAANEALLEFHGINVQANVAMQPLPDKADIRTSNTLEFFFPLLFVSSMMLNMRNMILSIGTQQDNGIIEAMELKGLDRRAFWLSAYINHFSTTLLTAFVVSGLIYAVGFFESVGYGSVLMDFVGFALAQVALSTLVLVASNGRLTANKLFIVAIVIFIVMQMAFLVFILVVVPLGISDAGVTAYFLLYMVPFAHILAIATEAELLEVPLSNDLDPFYSTALIMLVVDAIVYLAIALLVDEYGQYKKRHALDKLAQSQVEPVKAEPSAQNADANEEKKPAVENGEEVDVDPKEYGIVIRNLVKKFTVPATKNKETGNYDLKTNETLLPKSVFGGQQKELRAIDGLSLTVKKNEIFCLLGHNGAGKTTTFNCLVGSVAAASGEAWVNGYHITRERGELRKNLGVCPQQDISMPHVKAFDQLVFQAMLFGKTKEEAEKEATYLLDALELTMKGDEYPKNMSGGQRRRLTLLLALIGAPKVIVLDEPTTGLDPNNRRKIWKLLQDLKKDHTILMTTHSLEEADALADTIAIMSDGKLNVIGSSLELKRKYGSGYRLTCLKDRSALAEMTEEEEALATDALKDSIEKFVPGITVLSNAGAEAAFGLSTEHEQKFTALFEYLESAGKVEHHLSSFGLSPTTLEDVFLNLEVKQYEEENEDAKEGSIGPVSQDAIVKIADLELQPTKPTTFKQSYAILAQVLTAYRRTPMTYAAMLIYPVVFAIIFSEVSNLLAVDPPLPQALDLATQATDAQFTSLPTDVALSVDNAVLADFFSVPFVSEAPTLSPSLSPVTPAPSKSPTDAPTTPDPTASPTDAPTTAQPTQSPTTPDPTTSPTDSPTTSEPTQSPTTADPTTSPTDSPVTPQPTTSPSTPPPTDPIRRRFQDDISSSDYDLSYDVNDTDVSLYDFLAEAREENIYLGGFEFNALSFDTETANDFVVDVNLIVEQTSFLSLPTLLQTVYSTILTTHNSAISGALLNKSLKNKINFRSNERSLQVDGDASGDIELETTYQSFPPLQLATDLTGGGASYIIAMALAFQTALLTLDMLVLRKSGVKEMLLLSGLPRRLFWGARVFCSSMLLLIPGVIIYIVLLAYGTGGAAESTFFAFFMLFLLFGIATVLFGFMFSFFSDDEETGPQFAMEVTNICLIIPFLLSSFVFTPNDEYTQLFNNLFTVISPAYGAYIGLATLDTEAANGTPIGIAEMFIWDRKFLQLMVFQLVSIALYGSILFAIDGNVIAKYRARRHQKFLARQTPDSAEVAKEDAEAAKEQSALQAEAAAAENLKKVREGILPAPISAIPHGVNEQDLRILSKNVNKRFVLNDKSIFHAVTDASLGIRRNEIFGLLGPNGAGKTTLIRCMTGLNGYVMDQGTAQICGYSNMTQMHKILPLMGICPQFDALLKTLTPRELLRMFARIRGVKNAIIEDVVQAYLDMLNLTPKADSTTKNLSGGNKRRLSVALSFIGSPRAIFMDEPSTGLDPSTRRKLWTFLQQKASAKLDDNGQPDGRAILLTTHSMEEADALCTNIAIMVNGSVRTVGTSQELKTRYSAGYVVVMSVGLESDKEGMKNLMQGLHKEALLLDDSMTNVRYFLPEENVTWAKIFEALLASQEKLKMLDFAVSQRTLEDVFIEFANLQPDEE